jgi:hypothetical protein
MCWVSSECADLADATVHCSALRLHYHCLELAVQHAGQISDSLSCYQLLVLDAT